MTFFFKFIFPLLFLVGACSLIVFAWPGQNPASNGTTWPPLLIYLRLAFPLLIVGFVISHFGNLKRIYVDKKNLYISNYLKEIVVSIGNIQSVEEYPGPRLKPAKIRFREATDFGRQVEFVPRDSSPPWRRSVVVSELRKMADSHESAAPSELSRPENLLKPIGNVAIAVIVTIMLVLLSYGIVRFPDGPIYPCHTNRYCGKQGQPHTFQQYRTYKTWETTMLYVWPVGLITLAFLKKRWRKGT
jgi:hypothetical protein